MKCLSPARTPCKGDRGCGRLRGQVPPSAAKTLSSQQQCSAPCSEYVSEQQLQGENLVKAVPGVHGEFTLEHTAQQLVVNV